MRPVATRTRIQELLSRVGAFAGGPAEERAVERGLEMLVHPSPRRQREIAAERGLAALVAWAADRTESGGTA